MAGLTASGVGSGIDISSLVDQLVTAERQPEQTRLTRASSDIKLKLSALATLSSAFSTLQSSLGAIKGGSAFGTRIATSSKEEVFTVSAGSGAQTGRYDVEVLALASAHKLASAPLSESTGLGAGTLHISAGSTSFDVTINAGADTPEKIRDAINTAALAAGAKMSAGLVRGDSGASLTFSSNASGAANALRITRTAGSAGLDALVYDPGTLTSLTERTAASDAQVKVDGLLRSSAANQVTDAIPGVTLTLKKADVGSVHQLAVVADDSAASKAMSALVTAYNGAIDAMGRVTAYGGIGGTSGALIGDSAVRGAEARMRGIVGGKLASLAALGFNTSTDGKVSLDSGKLTTALATDPAGTQAKLKDLATSLLDVVDKHIGTGGVFTSRTESLNARQRRITDQTTDLDRRMEIVKARYTKQFVAMDTLVGQLNDTASYLTTQLDALAKL